MSTPAAEPGDILARLRSCADRIAALDVEQRAEHDRRDQLVTQARDLGTSWRTIARNARVSVSRCVAIVAGD